MRNTTIALFAITLLLTSSAVAQAPAPAAGKKPKWQRPVHTYSIVARDPATGEMGVAVQSHWFSVGSLVLWGEAGVGVVATQSFIDPSYGPLGLALMKAGKTAQQSLDALKLADEHPEVRQVAFLDVHGNVATHTGEKAIPGAGHIVGENFSVQANLMLNDKIWPAMAKAYRESKGDLAGRMMAALEAAQNAGGDIRGKQSAAMLIVKPKSTGRPWADRVMELRIEDHPEPIKELRRLIKIHRAYQHMNAGDLAIEEGDEAKALREYGAAEAMFPDNLEMKYWHAVSLVNMGRVEESLPLFREIFAKDKNWAELTPRLPKVGLLNAGEKSLQKIMAQAH